MAFSSLHFFSTLFFVFFFVCLFNSDDYNRGLLLLEHLGIHCRILMNFEKASADVLIYTKSKLSLFILH